VTGADGARGFWLGPELGVVSLPVAPEPPPGAVPASYADLGALATRLREALSSGKHADPDGQAARMLAVAAVLVPLGPRPLESGFAIYLQPGGADAVRAAIRLMASTG
jgi:hypothetical protein